MYFIAALTGLEESASSRCFGYYPEKEEALEAVRKQIQPKRILLQLPSD